MSADWHVVMPGESLTGQERRETTSAAEMERSDKMEVVRVELEEEQDKLELVGTERTVQLVVVVPSKGTRPREREERTDITRRRREERTVLLTEASTAAEARPTTALAAPPLRVTLMMMIAVATPGPDAGTRDTAETEMRGGNMKSATATDTDPINVLKIHSLYYFICTF